MARYRAKEPSYFGDRLYEEGEIAEIPDDLDLDIGENWEELSEDGRPLPPPTPPQKQALRHRIQPAPSASTHTPSSPPKHEG